jgi:hypothetical protein
MNKLLTLLLLFVFSLPGEAKWSVANVPIEFVWLVDSIQSAAPSERQRAELDVKFNRLEKVLKNINSDSLAFLIKSEIYKGILETQWHNLLSYRLLDENTPTLINEKIQKNKNELSLFSSWTIAALNSDIATLVASKEFKAKSPQMEKRIALLAPWATLILNTSPDQFEAAIRPVMFTIIDRIIRTTTFFAEQVRRPTETKGSEAIVFFTQSSSDEKEGPLKILPPPPDKVLESITIQKPSVPQGPVSALKNEILPNPKDKSIPLPDSVNDWPVRGAPKAGVLPTPVNDWLIPLDPNYQPTHVPRPTNDPGWFYDR